MIKKLGAAVTAIALAFAGSASAATYLIAEGTVTADGTNVDVGFGIPDPSIHAWEVTFTASAPIDKIDYDLYAKRHWHYEYDNPIYDYGDAYTYQLARTFTPFENGFSVRFDMPYDRAYRFDDPEFGFDYWEVWSLGLAWVHARVWPGEVGSATYRVTMTAVPEPATWAMMIIGFGAVGSMVRSSRRRNAFSAA